MRGFTWTFSLVLAGLLAIILAGSIEAGPVATPHPAAQASPGYAVLAWNDLGMHCYNHDFQDLAVLPPFNTLWVQVVRVADPPQIVTTGISVTYSFPENTYSYLGPNGRKKSNFWDYAPGLFGVTLAPDVGLAGKGLSGPMDLDGDHFVAVGIPLTEYRDQDVQGSANPMDWPRYPYQLARIEVRDATSHALLAQQTVVAPVSTEMHCDTCHSDGQREGISTGRVETNILTLHDQEEGTSLMGSRPVLCAGCHGSNALGTAGKPGIRSLSNVMHQQHMDSEVGLPGNTDGCYGCHPGPQTRCLRDVMSQKFGFTCQRCHGQLGQVAVNPNPWLNEPRCDNAACHGSAYAQDQALYRMSTGHGGIRCEGCHDSTHAIAPSREANDAIKFVALQGYDGILNRCGTCHLTPATGRIHPAAVTIPPRVFLPELAR